MPAIRTIPEAWINRLAALGTSLGGPEFEGACLSAAGFIKDTAAAAAFQEGLSPLDGNQRDEEKADIVVKAFEPGRRQAAPGTTPGLVIHLNLLGLYPPDEKEEDPPPGPIPAAQRNC